jgi:hypothetical protein
LCLFILALASNFILHQNKAERLAFCTFVFVTKEREKNSVIKTADVYKKAVKKNRNKWEIYLAVA